MVKKQQEDSFARKIAELENADINDVEDFFTKTFQEYAPVAVATPMEKHEPPQSQKNIQRPITIRDTTVMDDDAWFDQVATYNGQLAVDVIDTPNAIIIISAVAGVRARDLDISVHGDIITIKGIREQRISNTENEHAIIQECFWGGFSRSIILPSDIQHDAIDARLEQGVLTLTLPKSNHSRHTRIDVQEILDDA